MPSAKTITTILVLVAVLIFVFFIYRYFLDKYRAEQTPEPGLTQTAAPAEATGRKAAKEFLDILSDLRRVDLRSDSFETPFFKSLSDFSPDIVTQTPGRVNPFVPPSSESGGGGD